MTTDEPASGNGPALPKGYREAFDQTSTAEHTIEGLALGIGQLVADHFTEVGNPVHTALNAMCLLLDREIRAVIDGRQHEWNVIREGRA